MNIHKITSSFSTCIFLLTSERNCAYPWTSCQFKIKRQHQKTWFRKIWHVSPLAPLPYSSLEIHPWKQIFLQSLQVLLSFSKIIFFIIITCVLFGIFQIANICENCDIFIPAFCLCMYVIHECACICM